MGALDKSEERAGVTSASTLDDIAVRVQSGDIVVIQINDAGGMGGSVQVKASTDYDPNIRKGNPTITGSWGDLQDPVPMDKPVKFVHLVDLPVTFVSLDTSSLTGTADVKISMWRGGR